MSRPSGGDRASEPFSVLIRRPYSSGGEPQQHARAGALKDDDDSASGGDCNRPARPVDKGSQLRAKSHRFVQRSSLVSATLPQFRFRLARGETEEHKVQADLGRELEGDSPRWECNYHLIPLFISGQSCRLGLPAVVGLSSLARSSCRSTGTDQLAPPAT